MTWKTQERLLALDPFSLVPFLTVILPDDDYFAPSGDIAAFSDAGVDKAFKKRSVTLLGKGCGLGLLYAAIFEAFYLHLFPPECQMLGNSHSASLGGVLAILTCLMFLT